jgi:hypothetical protein
MKIKKFLCLIVLFSYFAQVKVKGDEEEEKEAGFLCCFNFFSPKFHILFY